jgi:hypothetical protein
MPHGWAPRPPPTQLSQMVWPAGMSWPGSPVMPYAARACRYWSSCVVACACGAGNVAHARADAIANLVIIIVLFSSPHMSGELDAFSARSHHRPFAASRAGKFRDQMVPNTSDPTIPADR